jgi:carnosine N-methyltransferase
MKYEERVKKFTNCIKKNSEFCFLMVAAYVDLFPDIDLSAVNYVSDLPYFP